MKTAYDPCNYKRIRKLRGMTAQAVATEIGVSISTLFSWEAGKTSPDSVYIAKLAKLYGCSADDLIMSSD